MRGGALYATIQAMIKTWEHKGLQKFYQTGSKSGIQPKHVNKLKIILQLLDAIANPLDMNLPGMSFHTLTGKSKGFYSVTVNANWRVIFKFDGKDVILVDYLDYH